MAPTPPAPAAAPRGRRRLVLGLVLAAVVLLGGLVAVQVLVGGVPVVDALVPRSGPELDLVDGAPPTLDCGAAEATGGVVAGALVQRDLAAAARSERDVAPARDSPVGATGYRRGAKAAAVVWVDGAGRARLVLTYVGSGPGWVLTGRSGCTL